MIQGELWEVFIRLQRGAAHRHVGSVRAADRALALQAARDVYTRRDEVASLWVVRSTDIAAYDPEALPAEGTGKIYRNPDFYTVPAGVERI